MIPDRNRALNPHLSYRICYGIQVLKKWAERGNINGLGEQLFMEREEDVHKQLRTPGRLGKVCISVHASAGTDGAQVDVDGQVASFLY